MKILVTGGAGYIGSHFVREALKESFDVIVLDNLCRGHREAVPENVKFLNADLHEREKIVRFLKEEKIEAVVHFAAYAYVGESVDYPLRYYENNVVGSFNLLSAVQELKIGKFIFSSTCSLYGNPLKIPISEDEPIKPINPYARTKSIIEDMLRDLEQSQGLKYIALRYFNAAGADISGKIGESHDPEPHLIPLVLKTALGERESVFIFGDDYDTADGTCIRDYIHVTDLAKAHLAALNYLGKNSTSAIFNLGTGNGYSVKEIIDAAEKISKRNIKSVITKRRAGDPAVLVASNLRTKEVLGWKPEFDLDGIISSAWKWHKNQKY